jgi:acetolactate synthase I/II/III large subunit
MTIIEEILHMKMKGSELLGEALMREGVDVIFGYPGGVVLPFYDYLYGSRLRHILVRHEQGATHMADGYSRATGKVGVALVTSGPAATNTVTGLTNAHMDSIPMVVITGQVPTAMIGNDAFQEADIVGMTRPCTKYSFLLKSSSEITQAIKEAFYIASTGRPGPVLIDVPKDVFVGEAKAHFPEKVNLRSYRPTYEGHPGQIKVAAQAILKARKPVLYTGGGIVISGAAPALTALSEYAAIPVTNTLLGLGGIAGDHPNFLGMLGMHGTWYANMAVAESDLLIAVGARFDDRATGKIDEFAKHAQIIHIDIDPSGIEKNIKVDIPIVGDARQVLEKLVEEVKRLAPSEQYEAKHQPWNDQIIDWKASYPLHYELEEDVIKPQWLIEEICRFAPEDAIIATDVGQHQMWTAQYFKFRKPRTLLTSGGLGTMGFGFPAALGAQAAYPDRPVIAIVGDGGFQMNIQELATAAQYNLPVKTFIVNNSNLGMVRQWQEIFYQKRYSHVDLSCSPDFVKVAEAYGVKGLRATKPSELDDMVTEAMNHNGPVVMECKVAPEENVFPMVGPGCANHNMLLKFEKKDEIPVIPVGAALNS